MSPAAAKAETDRSRAKYKVISRTLYHINVMKGWNVDHKHFLPVTDLNQTIQDMDTAFYVTLPQRFPAFDPTQFLVEFMSIGSDPKYDKKPHQQKFLLPQACKNKIKMLIGISFDIFILYVF